MLGEVARDGQAAAPGERPVGECGVRVAGLDLDGVPQRQHLVGEVQADALEPRDRPNAGVAQDEPAVR